MDLNSSNGTYVNGQRVLSPTTIKDGDQIRVGSSLLVFSAQDGPADFPTPAAAHDLVDLSGGNPSAGSSILAAVNSADESVIIQPPETADAVAAWNVVYKIAGLIGAVDSVTVFLEQVCDLIFEHLIVDHLIVLTRSHTEEELRPQIVRSRFKERDRRKKVVASQTIINHVLETKEGVLCADAMTDQRFTNEDLQDSIHRFGLQSMICVPIVARGEVRGVFHLDCARAHHTYTQEQLRLAVAIGRLCGIAIENAELLHSRMKHERLAATGETVAYLSHHIRNILQGLHGGVDVVELGLRKDDVDTMKSGWTMVRRNLDRIYHLAVNLLTFSKDRHPSVESVQLNRIIEDAMSLVQTRAAQRSVAIASNLDEIPPVPCDAEGAHQAIQNILLNAIDASPSKTGQIRIRSEFSADAGEVIVTIEDNGRGIEAQNIKTIFDAFQSGKGQGGTGIGLAAAKKIMDEMHGHIEVDSVVDEGTTFRLRFPIESVRLAGSDDTHGPAAS